MTTTYQWPARYAGEEKTSGFDWTRFLQDGETISTSGFAVPSGLTKVSETIIGAKTVVKISGGSPGVTYTVTNTIVTSAGNTYIKKARLVVAS